MIRAWSNIRPVMAMKRWLGLRRRVAYLTAPSHSRRRNREATPPVVPPPTLETFVRVVAIGQTRRHTDLALTLLSTELYTDGFLLHMLLLLDKERPLPPSRGRHTPSPVDVPRPTFVVSDDRGNEYSVWPSAWSGVRRKWRIVTQYSPALDPAARELRVAIPTLRWEGIDQQPSRSTAEVQPGSWRFVIPLAPNHFPPE